MLQASIRESLDKPQMFHITSEVGEKVKYIQVYGKEKKHISHKNINFKHIYVVRTKKLKWGIEKCNFEKNEFQTYTYKEYLEVVKVEELK